MMPGPQGPHSALLDVILEWLERARTDTAERPFEGASLDQCATLFREVSRAYGIAPGSADFAAGVYAAVAVFQEAVRSLLAGGEPACAGFIQRVLDWIGRAAALAFKNALQHKDLFNG